MSRALFGVLSLGVASLLLMGGSAPPASSAEVVTVVGEERFVRPRGVVRDPQGNLYVSDSQLNVVYRVSPEGEVSVVAGTGQAGYSGDGGPATAAALNHPGDVVLDGQGGLLIADTDNHRVRRVSPDGVISTVAGTGEAGFTGDGGPAVQAALMLPHHLALDPQGRLYVSVGRFVQVAGDVVAQGRTGIRRVDPDGAISTLPGVGNPQECFLCGREEYEKVVPSEPNGLHAEEDGSLLFADPEARRVGRVAPDGTVSTLIDLSEQDALGYPVAVTRGSTGALVFLASPFPTHQFTGSALASVDASGQVTAMAQLKGAADVAPGPDGALLVADTEGSAVVQVGPDGALTPLAGGGALLDGLPLSPADIAVEASGALLIADSLNHRVVRRAPDGTLSTVAGRGGQSGFEGDGGPATAALLSQPSGVAAQWDGGFLVADAGNNRIRRVDPEGVITTVAGNGANQSSGNGGPALAAAIARPTAVAVDASGGILIAEREPGRVRRVGPDGTISLVAGNGSFFGPHDPGMPAAEAALLPLYGLAVDASGGVLAAEEWLVPPVREAHVWRVSPEGLLSSVVDSVVGVVGVAADSSGSAYVADNRRVARVAADGSETPLAETVPPHGKGLAIDASGNLLLADPQNHRVLGVMGVAAPGLLAGRPLAVRGDVDSDGRAGISDVLALLRALVGLEALQADALARGDLSGDGRLDLRDVILLLRQVAQLPGAG